MISIMNGSLYTARRSLCLAWSWGGRPCPCTTGAPRGGTPRTFAIAPAGPEGAQCLQLETPTTPTITHVPHRTPLLSVLGVTSPPQHRGPRPGERCPTAPRRDRAITRRPREVRVHITLGKKYICLAVTCNPLFITPLQSSNYFFIVPI